MKRITTTLLLLASLLGAAQELTFIQSMPNEAISIRLTKSYGNWQHRIIEVSNKGGLMLGGVGYQFNSIVQFTNAVDLVVLNNGADIRFEAMASRQLDCVAVNVFAQKYIGQEGMQYGFGLTVSIPQY